MSRKVFCAALLVGLLSMPAQADECALRTAKSATVVIPGTLSITVNGVPLSGDVEVTARTPANVCGGSAEWSGAAVSMTLWGDDAQTPADDGFQQLDALAFRVRDLASGYEYDGETAHFEVEYGADETFYRTDGLFDKDAIYLLAAVAVTTTPATPSDIQPVDGAVGMAVAPNLSWSSVAGADSYQLELATDSLFSDVIDARSQAATSVEPVALQYGSSYYWRVRAVNAAGASGWSPTRTFTTIVAAPALLQPADGASDQPVGVDLTWEASTSADGYRVEVASTNDFEQTVFAAEPAGTTAVVSGLTEGLPYFWRVQAVADGAAGSWSTTFSFTTASAPLPPPSPSPDPAPPVPVVRQASVDPAAVTLAWSPSPDADAYLIQVAETDAFSSLALEESVVDTSLLVSDLDAARTYFWRVQARHGDVGSDWSSAAAFTTTAAAPVLLLPADGAGNRPVSLDLTWEASSGADGYEVQIASTSDFGEPVFASALFGTTAQVSELTEGQQYFWRVRAVNAGGAGSWSTSFSFETEPPAAPAGGPLPDVDPELRSPADGSVLNDTLVTLSWHPVDHAASYHVRIYEEDGSFRQVRIDSSGVGDTDLTIELNAGRSYSWEVQAANEAGTGPWSPLARFDLSDRSATAEGYRTEMPDAVLLHQNYPNPFNPSTTIAFEAPRSMHVRLVIYNLLGAEQEVLLDQHIAAGRHELRWRADALPSGTYVCRMEAGGTQTWIKLLLVK